MNKVLFSSNSDNWCTPKVIYDSYINKGYFDPCPLNSEFNGLEIEWKQKNFVNPPFSKIKEFVDKSIIEFNKGKKVVLLIPARTDTKYYKKLVDFGCTIIFITGRLHFNNSNSAPFPSCYIILNGKTTQCFWRNRIEGE